VAFAGPRLTPGADAGPEPGHNPIGDFLVKVSHVFDPLIRAGQSACRFDVRIRNTLPAVSQRPLPDKARIILLSERAKLAR
jgi:hypothetical protein